MGNRFQDAPLLVASLVVSLALLGGGYWLVKSQGLLGEPSPTVATVAPGPPPALSGGEQVLLMDSPDKAAAVAARRAGEGLEAIALLQKSLRNRPNDPEALIYLNNWQTADHPQRTIAVAVPASTLPDVAKELLRGVAEAQTHFNQQAIGDWRLRVEIADDSNHPGTAQAVAQELVQDPAVLGVVGHFSSTTSLAAAKVYQAAGLTMISPSSTAVGLSDLGDAILRTVPSDRQAGQALAMVARQQLQLRRVAVFFNPKSAYSQSLKTEFVQQFSADGQGEVQVQEIGTEPIDAQRALEQVTASNGQGAALFGQRPEQASEAVVLLGDRQTLPSELAIVDANRRRLPILSGDSLYSIDLLKLGANAQGTILAIPWHADLPQSADFVTATRHRWGGDVSWRTAMAYDATQALIAALAGETTRSGVRQALHRSGFQATGASAPVRFSATGDRALPLVLITVRPGKRSGTGFDFGLLK